ncbi:MAG: DUF4249 domain-containing protein [Prevotellaceae bacterium]|jgi:hypothetical protein|nr:DUF4249 domain-containing protein [Prevotellaceae bacterium]
MRKRRIYTVQIASKAIVSLLFLVGGVYSCVTEYVPDGLEKASSVMVVDGLITNEISYFKLTKTVGLLEDINDIEVISNASLYIERDDGVLFQNTSYLGNGRYSVETEDLDPSRKYGLYIRSEGKEYRSEFLEPIITTAIDRINLSKAAAGEPVYVCVSTHDSSDKTPYYMWQYEEIWEVHAQLFGRLGWLPGTVLEYKVYDRNTSDNMHHCWGRDTSEVYIGAADKLAENVVIEKKLKGIEAYNDRFTVMYYVKMQQNQLRKEAYDYFYNLRESVEESGGLFPPMPTNRKGNIECISDPNTNVLGYVEVSTTAYKEHYFPEVPDIHETPPYVNECPTVYILRDSLLLDVHPPRYAPVDTLWYAFVDGPGYCLYLEVTDYSCVDCRLKGTKDRPIGWPTNNY